MGQLTFQKLRFSPDLRRLPQTNKPWKGSTRQHFYSLVMIENPYWTFSGSSPRLPRTTCPWKIFVGLTTNSVQIFNTWYTRRCPCLYPLKRKPLQNVLDTPVTSKWLGWVPLNEAVLVTIDHIVPAPRDHLFYSVKFILRITGCKKTLGSLMILLHFVDFISVNIWNCRKCIPSFCTGSHVLSTCIFIKKSSQLDPMDCSSPQWSSLEERFCGKPPMPPGELCPRSSLAWEESLEYVLGIF